MRSLNNRNKQGLAILFIAVLILGWFMLGGIIGKAQDQAFMEQHYYYYQANTYFEEEQYEKALQLLEPLIKSQPNSIAVLELSAKTYYEIKKYGHALLIAKHLLEVNPHKVEDEEFLLLLGELFYQTEEYKNAEYVLKQVETQLRDEKNIQYKNKITQLQQAIQSQGDTPL